MTANVNTETGIPYGVVNGNNVPYLIDEIQTSGDDLSYAAFKRELRETVAAALRGVVENHTGKECAARIVESVDCDEIVESLLDSGLNDRIEIDESEYAHETTVSVDIGNGAADCKVKYLQGWLGGAPLIWILESPYLAYAPVCSPCVPNAGDLDNMGDDGETGGILCYCAPPDDFNSDDESADEYRIAGEIERNGKTYKIVAKTAKNAETAETTETE